MVEMEEMEAAETRMIRAKNALLSYVEQRKDLDREQYLRLVSRVKKAEAEFQKTLSRLGR